MSECLQNKFLFTSINYAHLKVLSSQYWGLKKIWLPIMDCIILHPSSLHFMLIYCTAKTVILLLASRCDFKV